MEAKRWPYIRLLSRSHNCTESALFRLERAFEAVSRQPGQVKRLGGGSDPPGDDVTNRISQSVLFDLGLKDILFEFRAANCMGLLLDGQ